MPSRQVADDRFALLARRLDERIADLCALGPGEVRCDRVHEIDDIRTVRACEELVSANERAWIVEERARAAEALFGLQLSGPSVVSRKHRSKKEPDHWIQLLVPAITHPLRTLRQVRTRGHDVDTSELTQLVEEAERAPLPAPHDLLDAAEHWLLAGLAEGTTRRPLTPLRLPWERAHVVPLGEWDRF